MVELAWPAVALIAVVGGLVCYERHHHRESRTALEIGSLRSALDSRAPQNDVDQLQVRILTAENRLEEMHSLLLRVDARTMKVGR